MPHDVVTFGEAMVRLTPQNDCRLEQTRGLDVTVGGGELNVAVSVSRLGFRSAWVSRLPYNALGRLVVGKAREQGVDTSYAAYSKEGRCGIYFLEQGASPRAAQVLYDRNDSAISRIKPGDVDWAKVFDGVKYFHVSGITPALSKSAAETTAEALAFAKSAGCTVTYDLNYRAKLWSPLEARACQEPFMQFVDTLITTEEDTRVVFGIEAPKGSDENFTNVDAVGYRLVAEQLAERFKLRGVAITLRQNKSVWFNDWWGLYYDAVGKQFYQAPKIPVEIVDRVGAGDSFAGGLLAALLINPGDYDYAIRFAIAASAIKHTIPGDFNYITRAEVETLMKGGGLRIVR